MLNLNNIQKFDGSRFPDGSQMLLDVKGYGAGKALPDEIFWHYESDEECMTLFYLVKHIRRVKGEDAEIILYVNYLPNARMDRVKSSEREVFTLKYFCEFINSLKFSEVHVLDPHSDVGVALLDRVVVDSPEQKISSALARIRASREGLVPCEDIMVYFPDAGAYKRYKDLKCFTNNQRKVYGQKVRNWETGKIEALRIVDENATNLESEDEFKGKIILMIDDIISYGGTLYFSAVRLKELGAEKIFAYASHTENSVLDEEKGSFIKLLEDETVERLFTTDSIYTGKHEKITIV